MSRAFAKDADYVEQLPERPVSEHPNDVTEAGLAKIEQALAAASEAYAAAQASTDRAAIAAAGRDLRYWSARRATARVVPGPTDHSEVRFGTSVTIVRDDGREQTFRIVGEDEADPSQGSISHVSPLARSMFGQRVGDVVHAGAGEAEIIRIRDQSTRTLQFGRGMQAGAVCTDGDEALERERWHHAYRTGLPV